MSSRPVPWRRLGVSVVAVATLAAGMPLLLSTAANAVPVTALSISQQDGRTSAAAGTCTAFVVKPQNVLGTDTSDPATITVRISESPASDTQDVDFCTVAGMTPFAPGGLPGYQNAEQVGGDPNTNLSQERYGPGPSITPATGGGAGAPAGTEGNPDVASGTTPVRFGASDMTSRNNNNPVGADTAQYRVTSDIVFGVVALTPGTVNVDAFVDDDANGTNRSRDSGETQATQRRLTVTDGGRQGSAEAANAVRRVELVDAPDGDEESVAVQSSGGGAATHDLLVSLFNAAGDRVTGVRPVLRAASGPNAPSAFAPNGTFTASCDQVLGQGFAAPCTYTAAQSGRDLLVAYVDQANGTANQDAAEPADTVNAMTLPPTNTTPTAARSIDLRPDSASVPAGERRTLTATVTDVAGAPVQGVQVRFDESGAGAFVNPATQSATSTVSMTTDALGQATVQFASSHTESGSNTVSATITTTNTQCTSPASGSTPAGRCTDSSFVTLTTATASPSPSATPTATISPRPSASATTSPRPTTSSAPACTVPASITLDRSTIIATGSAQITVRGTPNSTVEVQAYSRPSTTYRVVRTFNLGSDGTASDRIVPPTNTRLFAQQRGCNASESIVLNVRTQISLNVVRNGTRNYTFSGSLLPARPNGLIASLYRVTSDGRQILAAQTRANANVGQAGYDSSRPPGSYSIRRQFTGSGRFGFVVRTGQDLQNAPGSSNVRSLAVF